VKPAFPTLPAPHIPVAKPRLPEAHRLMPYLERLDQSRIYANIGPVCQELKERLGKHFDITEGGLALTASGSAALVGAILAAAGRRTNRPIALCASYTFVATLSAIQCCGYDPHLADIDPNTWALDPDALRRHPRLHEVGLLAVTAPYGRLPDLDAWARFRRDTGIPVVIDAAASFDVLERLPRAIPPDLPVVLSFHATKAFGCGEGGAVICTDPDLFLRVIRATNNGFFGARHVIGDNINGKMSEYHGCVAMAALDYWGATLWDYKQTAKAYHHAANANGIDAMLRVGGDTSYAYALLHTSTEAQAIFVRDQLAAKGIDSRFWYGRGLHRETGFGPFDCDPMPVTDSLSHRLLGLPFYADLAISAIEEICKTVAQAMEIIPIEGVQNVGRP